MAQRDDGCLNGILIGCAGLLVLVLGAGTFGYYKVVRPVQERVARVGEIGEESVELRQRLEELDTAVPYEAPEDPAEIVLEEEDVERYLAVRTAVAEELARVVEPERRSGGRAEPSAESGAEASAEAEGDTASPEPGLSDIGEMFSTTFASFEREAEARVELQRAALEALSEQRMSPRELRTLLHLIEWRFLGREEAAFFGLPSDERSLYLEHLSELRSARRTLPIAERFNAEIDGRSADEIRARIERTRMEISLLRDRASENREIDSRTRALLEQHRGSLEEPGGEGVDLLATLTEQEVREPPEEMVPGG